MPASRSVPPPPVPLDATVAKPSGFDNLLNTAATEFARFGLDGASLRHIGRDAGIGAPLICYHFENKQGLYLEAFEHITEQTFDHINEKLARCQQPALRLRTLVEALYDLLVSQRELTALLQRDIIDATLGERTLLSSRLYRHFVTLIGQEASAFAGAPCGERRAFSVMALILGYSLLSHVRALANREDHHDAVQADRLAVTEEALQLVTAGRAGTPPA